jgi:hypothetical protein
LLPELLLPELLPGLYSELLLPELFFSAPVSASPAFEAPELERLCDFLCDFVCDFFFFPVAFSGSVAAPVAPDSLVLCPDIWRALFSIS